MKKWGVGLLLLALILALFPVPSYATGFNQGYPEGVLDIDVTPQGLAPMQTVKVKVRGEKEARPKVVWVQSDGPEWTATYTGGPKTTLTNGSGDSAVPKKERTDFILDMRDYAPESMKDQRENAFPISEIKNLEISDMAWKAVGATYTPAVAGGNPEFQAGTMTANIKVYTGYPLNYNLKTKFGTRADGANKYTAEYYIPMDVKYEGYVVEKKQMRVLQNATLQVNDSKNLQAQVRTMATDMTDFSNNWNDVTSATTNTIWSSDNSAVATVDQYGKVVAHAEGTAHITAKWNKYPYSLYGTATITVGGGEGSGSGECTYTIQPPNKIAAPQASFMDPAASGVILGDDAANGIHFDAPTGIPTSDHLYANAWGKNYLFEHTFANMAGQIRYSCSVDVTYPTKWEEAQPDLPGEDGGDPIPQDPIPKDSSFDKTYTFELTPREYAYWQIDQLSVYQIDRALMENYALPDGSVTLYPNNYNPPALELANSTVVEEHVVPQETGTLSFTPEVVDGGDHEPGPDDVDDSAELKSLAESQTNDPKVQNDRLVFNGQIIMDDTVSTKTGPVPGRIADPQDTGGDVLYQGQLMINRSLLNRANAASSGSIYYTMLPENVEGRGDQSYPINGINSVTVHTPVVNYSLLPDDNRPYDQRMDPDYDRTVLILDRPFTVHFTESGQHLNIPGYGNRDYGKYTQNKRIQFPFDVFQEGQYYPENTWINIPVGTPYMNFTMPTWVNEGDYTIHTQSWAINAPSDGAELCQVNLNGNLANYCAAESFNVGVVGRLFDFRIWDIGDFRFEKVFRTGTGNLDHSSAMYYTGGNDENGAPTALSGQRQWHHPIRKGSHPTEQLTIPHNGYSFLFDFRTIGNLWQPGEGIRIEPSFYFIPKTGGSAAPVDLYYDVSGSGNKMIGVGSPKDKLSYTRTYRLADGLRNISGGELSTAASYEYNYILTEAERGQTNWLKFYEQYVKRKTEIAEGYNLEILPYTSRTLVGPTNIPNGVNPIAAVRSVQHWYGEYNLPIAPYILPKGTNIVTLANHYGGALDGHEQEFITGGYILVKFEIYTVKNSDAGTRILGYKAPEANMWAIEGQMTADTDEMGQTFSFTSGDIILFESDFSVRNDYQGQGK
jgi:hypothetical protein